MGFGLDRIGVSSKVLWLEDSTCVGMLCNGVQSIYRTLGDWRWGYHSEC